MIRIERLFGLILLLASIWILVQGGNAQAMPARFGVSPDNTQQLLTETIRSAKDSIALNIYQFDSNPIADVVVDRIRAGVTVQILAEGEPLGGISANGVKTLLRIRDEMKKSKNSDNRLYVMTDLHLDPAESTVKRRYRYNHAKYVVIDRSRTLIASENFTDTGHPAAGFVGNRGWEVVVEDATLAQSLLAIFAQDTNLKAGDVVRIGPNDPIPQKKSPEDRLKSLQPFAAAATPAPVQRKVPAVELGSGNVDQVELVTSPNSLPGIRDFIRKAERFLAVEQMSFPSLWKTTSNTSEQSAIVSEIISAARRGVSVRVLLNDEKVFGGNSPDSDTASPRKRPNEVTVELLNSLRECESLPIEARIVDIKKVGITYIHNKGLVADDESAFVSSINGTQNSVMNNRETAVALTSVDASRYYRSVFDFDWEQSPQAKTSREGCRTRAALSLGEMAPDQTLLELF